MDSNVWNFRGDPKFHTQTKNAAVAHFCKEYQYVFFDFDPKLLFYFQFYFGLSLSLRFPSNVCKFRGDLSSLCLALVAKFQQ